MKPYLIVAAALLLLGAILLVGTLGDPDEASRADESGTLTDRGEEPTASDTPTLRGQPKLGDDSAAPAEVGAERRVHSSGPGRIVGHLLTLEDGQGVAGVRITLALSSATDDDLEIVPFENTYVSGSDGAFVCDQLPRDGIYTLVFRHPGHAYAELPNVSIRRRTDETDIGVVLLDRASSLDGITVDAKGVPVPGVTVCAGNLRPGPRPVLFRYRGGSLNGACTTSGPDGRFRLTHLGRGYHRVRASKPGYASIERPAVRVGGSERGPLRLTLGVSRPIEGLVVDETGRAISGATVDVRVLEVVHAGSQGYARAAPWTLLITDEEGRFSVSDFPNDAGIGLALDVRFENHTSFSETYHTRPGEPLRITLARPPTPVGVSLEVRIVDEEGRPLLGVPGSAYVSLDSDEFDDDLRAPVDQGVGAARFPQVPPGSHHVGVALRGHRARREVVEVGDEPQVVSLTLARGAEATGRVLDAVTGEPISEAAVFTGELNQVLSDANGRFRLQGLEGGVRQIGAVTVTAEGYRAARPPLPFRKGEDHVEIEVRLQPLTALRTIPGQVVGPDARPVPGASLQITLANPTHYRVPARTDAEGRFAFRSIVPAHLRERSHVRVTHPAYARADLWRTPAELEQPLRVVLERGRRIRGRIVDEEGRPVALATAGARSTQDFGVLQGARLEGNAQDVDSLAGRLTPSLAASALVDAEGRFVLERVPTDDVQVFAFGPMVRWLIEDGQAGARIARGTADVDDVVLGVVRGWTLRGRVEDPQGRPLAGVRVSVALFAMNTVTDARGTFVLSPVFGASVVLTAGNADYTAKMDVTPTLGDGLCVAVTPR